MAQLRQAAEELGMTAYDLIDRVQGPYAYNRAQSVLAFLDAYAREGHAALPEYMPVLEFPTVEAEGRPYILIDDSLHIREYAPGSRQISLWRIPGMHISWVYTRGLKSLEKCVGDVVERTLVLHRMGNRTGSRKLCSIADTVRYFPPTDAIEYHRLSVFGTVYADKKI